jgi:hypothetical protein
LCCGEGVLEIKCPYCLSDSSKTFDEYLSEKKIIFKDDNGQYHWNKEHEYYYQIQLQMFLTSRKYGDLVVWRPQETIKVFRTLIDEEFLAEKMFKARVLFYQVIMPELMAGYFSNLLIKSKKGNFYFYYKLCKLFQM